MMADWAYNGCSGGNPLSTSMGARSTLLDMATVLWSSVRGSNQRGGDMLTGATVVHRKEALYSLRSRCMRARSTHPKPNQRFNFDYPEI